MTMTRDLDALSARTFDVLVVGGGIYGLTIAYDAAQRGLSVALIERHDFGSGASFNHLRTIHGGLRYLQTLDVSRARESVLERRALATIAPHTVRPLPFALALSRSITRGPAAMWAGFFLDRLVAADRNHGVVRSHVLPTGRVLSKDAAMARFPALNPRGLTGAAVWYDYVAAEADRLTLSFGLAAAAHGAVLANYVEATTLIRDGQRAVGVHARDRRTGRAFAVAARLTINATGSGIDALLTPHHSSTRMPMIKVMNLVTRRPGGHAAIGGRSASGRNLFLVPWHGRALFGTWESGNLCPPNKQNVERADVVSFVDELNDAFPSIDLTPDDVTLIHRGVVPAVAINGRVSLEGHEQIREHGPDGLEGLLSVAGAKYTTARRVAERITDRVLVKLGHPPVLCQTATAPLPGGALRDIDATTADARRRAPVAVSEETVAHLAAAYGSRCVDVLALCTERPELSARLGDDSPVIGAELVWAARHEMVVTLADAVIRRTPLGALGYPGDAAVARAAALVGAELGWAPERQAEEVAAVKQFYKWDTRA